jgi:dihydrodipicolinate synthase/N-acetylneuraminate lyase
MLDADTEGVYVIAATPFTETGEIDRDSVDRMVDFYVDCGVSGVTVLGMIDLVRLIKAGSRAQAHDLFDLHLPLLRYEQQPGVGLAVRKYVLKRRGVIRSDTQRKPARPLSPESIAEIEWMLSRVAAKSGRNISDVRPSRGRSPPAAA